MQFFKLTLVALVCFVAGGALVGGWLTLHATEEGDPGEHRQPLYWVAPMDPNYRRDGPGKSPMGMDLVPVYAEDHAPERAGDVRINPTVEHNLGVELGRVEEGAVPRLINTVGFVQFSDKALRHFHLRAEGWVSNLSVTSVGDPVEQGQKLFDFYSPEMVNVQQEYLSARSLGREDLAQSSLLKLRALGVSEREISALVQQRQLKQHLSYYADRDGFVSELNVRDGSYVKPDVPALSVGQLEDIWIIAEVFERQADWVEPGQPVTLTLDSFPGELWHAQVDYLYPILDSENRTLRARIVVPNDDQRLKPGMYASLQIAAGGAASTVSVPRRAVIRTATMNRVVKQVEPGVYRSVPVQLGAEIGDRVEIRDGLAAGEVVVVSGQFLIDSESNIEADLARMEGRHSGQHDEDTYPPRPQGAEDMEHRHDHGHATQGEQGSNASHHHLHHPAIQETLIHTETDAPVAPTSPEQHRGH